MPHPHHKPSAGEARLTKDRITLIGGTWTAEAVKALKYAHSELWPKSRPKLTIGTSVSQQEEIGK